MKNKKKEADYKKLFNTLKKEKVNTWFDLGLFLDKVKDNRKESAIHASYDSFKNHIHDGIALLSFSFGIDGVSIEAAKYSHAFEKIKMKKKSGILRGNKKPSITWIAGHFSKETETICDPRWDRVVMPSIRGFNLWDGYQDYFHNDLSRGSEKYNQLAKKIWEQTIEISLELAKLIIEKNINFLFPINVTSNPGNVPLAFALAIVSEYMDIPVLASHHDFYWEDGKRPTEKEDDELPGARDLFFRNSHLGEVFSLIEMLYPWNSHRWFHSTINNRQRDTLITDFGFSPISTSFLPTAINRKTFRPCSENELHDILKRLDLIFRRENEKLLSVDINSLSGDSSYMAREGKPLILGYEGKLEINIRKGSLLFLQPTRIIRRKRIELDAKIIKKLLSDDDYVDFLLTHPEITITLLVTGPMPPDQSEYFNLLINSFKEFYEDIPEQFRKRVFFAFAFGIENKPAIIDRGLKDLKINELYAASSLVLLPSSTEGRGLPIIESCATATPIVCHRYEPLHVYKEVIGEHLESSQRLEVFEFEGEDISDKMIKLLASVFIDPENYRKTCLHNREVINKRYCMDNLVKSIDSSLYALWFRLSSRPKDHDRIKTAFDVHNKRTSYNKDFKELVRCKKRKYLPGISINEFMVYLKSLIDPSYFRVEEMKFRGKIYNFSLELIKLAKKNTKITDESYSLFFKYIDNLFDYTKGHDPIVVDHSLSYRHRSRKIFPYRRMTFPELCGVVTLLLTDAVGKEIFPYLSTHSGSYLKDFKSSFYEMIGATKTGVVIDDSDRLISDLKQQKEIAFFTGKHFKKEISVFVLSTLKLRLGFSVDHELTRDDLSSDKIAHIAPVTLFARCSMLSDVTYDGVVHWIQDRAFHEVKYLYEAGLFRVVKHDILSSGIHLGQLGKEATRKLLGIKESDGLIIAFGEDSFMLDMVNMPSYRLGKVKDAEIANFLGLSINDSFIQWVPAALKTTLAYPTPIQTAKDLYLALRSKEYRHCEQEMGERKLLELLADDADSFGSSVKEVLAKLSQPPKEETDAITSHKITGIYKGGLPWSGAYLRVPAALKNILKFKTSFSGKQGQTVLSLIDDFEQDTQMKVSFAWNGGYILNPELVGKLGLPEKYIGSPLGFICTDGIIKSLPLYNKPAIIFDKEGNVKFKHVNIKNGLTIRTSNGKSFIFTREQRNKSRPTGPSFYDLLYSKEEISGKGRVVLRFIGNKIVEKIDNTANSVKILPVGLTISLPEEEDDGSFIVGEKVVFDVPGLEDVNNAIEAGPMLFKKHKPFIDMEGEGWTTPNSIATQAARLDYTNMRGPKIGVGLTSNHDLVIIAINGRIRESIGATHGDLAAILDEYGVVEGMGFDPGGSVTLVYHEDQLNISPYNKEYEKNIYSLPPTPRFVGNAVLAFIET